MPVETVPGNEIDPGRIRRTTELGFAPAIRAEACGLCRGNFASRFCVLRNPVGMIHAVAVVTIEIGVTENRERRKWKGEKQRRVLGHSC